MSAAVCTHPIDLIKVRMQLAGMNASATSLPGPIETAMNVVRNEGLFAGLYKVRKNRFVFFRGCTRCPSGTTKIQFSTPKYKEIAKLKLFQIPFSSYMLTKRAPCFLVS